MKYIKTFESVKGITFKEWLKINPHYSNVQGIDYIDCSRSNLINLNGIEKFTNLKYLYCQYNKLQKLPDLSKLKKLEELQFHNNKLTKLPELNELIKLITIDCSYNQLKELPDLSTLKNLEVLVCYNNKLTKLPDLFNLFDNLEYLDCSLNELPYNNLEEYKEWHKKEYPWKWEAKKYNL